MTYLSWCKCILLLLMALLVIKSKVSADDGYQLWFKYRKIKDKALLHKYQQTISSVAVTGTSKTCRIIQDELKKSLSQLLDEPIPFTKVMKNGTLLIGTQKSSESIRKLNVSGRLSKLGQEGYLIKSTKINGNMCIAIAAQTDIGLLYGTFHFLRLIQTQQQVERCGKSIFFALAGNVRRYQYLPGKISPLVSSCRLESQNEIWRHFLG